MNQPQPSDERVNTALEMIENLFKIVADIANRIVELEHALPRATGGETRSDFRFESYPPPETDSDHAEQLERARAAWERLDHWVDWLVATYRLTNVVPACWPQHATVTEELIGLRVAWVGAWSDTSSHEAILSWHERLARTRSRLADGNWGKPRCDGNHDESGLDLPEQYQAWSTDPARTPALLAARDRSLLALTLPRR
ncbi:hypothetical protein [Actinokineospora sp. UTMC 2448]|uniref:hypothetical protein n=1 Tax=Actinokineospora sp. UTMC 2448 TaxID=2268449 RepID=UPI002164AFF9|nr:hypothetical protein [Actinokineospora sp. UTMC 2448]UVS80584.1 hypothetical protein Actkin_04335 [Actinokineospora sp. UTMC 2448]